MKVALSVNHLYLQKSVRHVADKLAAVRYSCSYSVSHTSLFAPRWSAPFKISSPFFSAFLLQVRCSCWASQQPPSSTHKFLVWLNISSGKTRCLMQGSGHCPAWSVTVHELLKRLRPPKSFSRRQREQWLRDGTSVCRMKAAHLRLESLSGIFCCFCSAQGTKPKCCHLHIFLVESREKSGEHFGERFKLGMCLFPGLACLALNEIQSVFRQHQIRHN